MVVGRAGKKEELKSTEENNYFEVKTIITDRALLLPRVNIFSL